jgi:hypothetical protein
MSIQFRQIPHPRHRRGPVALQIAHPSFHMRLLLRLTHPAEERLEGVVASQGLVALVQLPLATNEHVRHHRLGIIPPHFPRHAAKEAETLDHAV